MRTGFFLTDSLVRIAVTGMLAALAIGCSNTAYLGQGEKLYTGANVTVDAKGIVPDKSSLANQLDLLTKPKPNGKLLGLFRLKLWLYNIGFFKETLGEPPVLLQSVSPDRVAARMRTLLGNKGYFWTDVQYKVREEEHTADIQYNIAIQTPYRINGITVERGDSALVEAIRSTMGETLLTAGAQYDLDKLKQ
jgi:outer membrane protein insertion porin family